MHALFLRLAAALLIVWAVAARLGPAWSAEQPLGRLAEWFGKKTPPPPSPDAQRFLEIVVELAWLADPVTFPYFLEARVDKTTLEVRGYVPTKAVRDQAVKIAHLRSPLTVVDALREQPIPTVRTSRLPPAQLQAMALAALRETFPRQHQHLAVRGASDGKVTVLGAVRSCEEKLSVSHALRRLPGCAGVHNLLEVIPQGPLPLASAAGPPNWPVALPKAAASEAHGPLKLPAPALPPVDAAPPTIVPVAHQQVSTPRLQAPLASVPLSALPSPWPVPKLGAPGGPYESRGVIVIAAAETKAAEPLPVRLKKRIEEACPGALDVAVRLEADQRVRIELRAQTDEAGVDFIGRISSLPEVQPYHVEYHIVLPPQLTAPAN